MKCAENDTDKNEEEKIYAYTYLNKHVIND